MSELKLEVGKRYTRADGAVGKCVENDGQGTYPFAIDYGYGAHWYTEDGRSIISPKYNITREITDDPAQATHPDDEPVRVITDEQQEAITAADVAAPAPLQLEVGKFYRARDGGVAEVTGVGDGAFYNDFTGKVGHFYCQRNSAGVFDGEQGETVFDLIEEILAPVAEAVAEMEFEAGPATHVFPHLGVKLEGDTFSAIDRLVDPPLHFDLRSGAINSVGQQANTESRGQREDREHEEDRQFGRIAQRAQHAEYLQTTRADRFATYCRAILFVMLGVAAMTFAARATARELLSIPNNAGGEIILTDTPSEHCDGAARLAISRAAGGKTIIGCWVYSDAGYVYVKWGDDLRLYKLTDFRIIEQFDESEKPAPPEINKAPWRGAL